MNWPTTETGSTRAQRLTRDHRIKAWLGTTRDVMAAGSHGLSTVYIDADACPVKDEVYRVAERYGLPVIVVTNSWIRTPRDPTVTLVVVDEGPDAADDWIAGRSGRGDIVVTADIPLADRVLRAGAQALHPTGRVFTTDSIGNALASRELESTCARSGKSPVGRSRS